MMSLSSPMMKPKPSTSGERSKKDRQEGLVGKSGMIVELEGVERTREVETIGAAEEIEAMVTQKDLGAATCKGKEEDTFIRPTRGTLPRQL